MTQTYYLYILANPSRSGFYIDVSRTLAAYKIQTRHPRRLVHVECFASLADAVTRAETLKRWSFSWVSALINEANPHWRDLENKVKLAA